MTIYDPLNDPSILDCAVIQIRPGVWISAKQLMQAWDDMIIKALCGKKRKSKRGKKGKLKDHGIIYPYES